MKKFWEEYEGLIVIILIIAMVIGVYLFKG